MLCLDLTMRECHLIAYNVSAWRSVGEFIIFSRNVSPIELPKMKITTIADKSTFSPEQKMSKEQKMRKSTSAPTDAKPHVSGCNFIRSHICTSNIVLYKQWFYIRSQTFYRVPTLIFRLYSCSVSCLRSQPF